ncbi:MAG: ABC transporter permease subunit [Candidatus Phosphoribacter sp.]
MIPSIWAWLTAPEHWSGPAGIPVRVLEHLAYSAISVVLAAALALPLGLWIGHTGRLRWLITTGNAARAVPSLGLLFAVSMIVGPRIQGQLAFVVPSIAVLVLLAVPPLVSGAEAGVRAVDPAARDAAYGMGMRGREVLWQVELPCALPLVWSGLRSATLQVVATATIAASVSLGGLGRYLIDGLAVRDYPQMAGGAVIVAVLAVIVDAVLAAVQRLAVSPGLNGSAGKTGRTGKLRRAEGVAPPKGRVLAPAVRHTEVS